MFSVTYATYLENKSDVVSIYSAYFLFSEARNIAINKPAAQSSDYSKKYPATNAVNGDIDDFSHTLPDDAKWWKVNLVAKYSIRRIELYNRKGFCMYISAVLLLLVKYLMSYFLLCRKWVP